MNVNRMFELLESNSQVEFINEFDKFGAEVYMNPNVQNAVVMQIDRIYLDKIESPNIARDWLSSLYLTCLSKRSFLSTIYFEKVIVCLIKIEKETNIDNCKKYAKHFPNNPLCKSLLDIEIPKDDVEEYNNIVNFESPFRKSEPETKEKKPLSLKKKMKKDILEKLKFQKSSRTTIAILYDIVMGLSSNYKEDLYRQCLKELKKKGEVYFADLNPYSEIHLQ
jgi:hypothetical protein